MKLRLSKLLVLLLILAIPMAASAQVILKLYKGSNKAIEYYVGDVLHFQLEGQDFFYDFEIKGLNHADQTITFEIGTIAIKDIITIKSYENYKTANVLEKTLYVFAAAWAGFSIVDVLYRGEDTDQVIRDALIVSGTSTLSGFIIKKVWGTRNYPMNTDEYFLGIVDLTVSKDD